SLAEICTWSWIEHNRYVLEQCHVDKNFACRYIRVKYEDFLASPFKILEQTAAFTGLKISAACTNYLQSNPPSWTMISQPKADKWKEKNLEAINQIMPAIIPMMQKLGYQI
ncbi:MAG: sulfotransferase, partial [Cyanothece sp. SIO1E1]|nr:sulfotransferase [Cyanothece sp. SIO1E1]